MPIKKKIKNPSLNSTGRRPALAGDKSKTNAYKSSQKTKLTNKQKNSRNNKNPLDSNVGKALFLWKATEFLISNKEACDVGHDEYTPMNYIENNESVEETKGDKTDTKAGTKNENDRERKEKEKSEEIRHQ